MERIDNSVNRKLIDMVDAKKRLNLKHNYTHLVELWLEKDPDIQIELQKPDLPRSPKAKNYG